MTGTVEPSQDDGEDPAAAPGDASPGLRERFDWVITFLYWLRRRRIARSLPDRVLKPVDYLINLVMQYLHYRDLRSGIERDSWNLFEVSPTDHVRIPSLFIVELFTPSVIRELDRADKRNGWASRQKRSFDRMPSLDEARSGERWRWWNHGALVRRDSDAVVLEAAYGRMPKEFDSVELKGLQIGQGITAIMAKFDLNDAASERLDQIWHRDFKPELDWGTWGGRWPRPLDADFVAFKRIQEERGRLHSVARQWFSAKYPGFFASNRQPQPLLDIVLFAETSAYPDKRPSHATDGAIRALGLPNRFFVQRSASFPAMILGARAIDSDSDMEDRRTWGLWGNGAEVLDGLSEPLSHYGSNPGDSSIAHYAERAIQDYFLRLSISEMLEVCQARYAAMRDAAQQHGQLERLRASLLTLSVDMSSIDRDIRSYNSRGWRSDGAQFFYEDAPFLMAEHDELGIPSIEPINLNEYLHTDQLRTLESLRAADNDYRGILTAAASLTSSLRSIRLAWAAIWVAAGSFVVAVVTLLVTDISKNSLLGVFAHWVGLTH